MTVLLAVVEWALAIVALTLGVISVIGWWLDERRALQSERSAARDDAARHVVLRPRAFDWQRDHDGDVA